METFKERIKYLRGEKTQSEFAAIIGATKQKISNYEAGIIKPSFEILEQIAEKLNVNINWLLTGKGNIKVVVSSEDDSCERIKELEEERRLLLDKFSQITLLTQAVTNKKHNRFNRKR
jgi:transcriptional regulator with XRE-family HTH domain